MKRIVDLSCIVLGVGLLVFGGYLVWERYTPKLTPLESRVSLSPYPTSIAIPKIGVILPILPSEYKNNKFQTTKDGVSYLLTSPAPGTVGNSVMYGHNWPNLLGKLPQVMPGDKIIVSHGTKKIIYSVIFTYVVNANETHIHKNTNDTRLTLYTCTGLFDTKRFVITAIAS